VSRANRAWSCSSSPRSWRLFSIAQVEDQVQVFGGVQFPPRRGHPCGWEGRGDRQPVNGYELVQLQSGEGGNATMGTWKVRNGPSEEPRR
jgi:hypothetical protein